MESPCQSSLFYSNVHCGLLNNNLRVFEEPTRLRCRAYFKVAVKGEFRYRFWFSNNCYSTMCMGELAYPDRKGKPYTIHSFRVFTSDILSEEKLTGGKTVYFGGSETKTVTEGEEFYADPLSLSVREGQYLVTEIELTGTEIPVTEDSQTPEYEEFNGSLLPRMGGFKPNFIACDRPAEKKLIFLGDSITQGCGTTFDAYDHWAARISAAMTPKYACADLGLGFARSTDFLNGQSWHRAANGADYAIVCYGVNDILHANGVGQGGADPQKILESLDGCLSLLQDMGIEPILFNVPPFNYDEFNSVEVWRTINRALPELAQKHGIRLFDVAAVLSNPAPCEYRAKYGPHPDGGGGEAIMKEFIRQMSGFFQIEA